MASNSKNLSSDGSFNTIDLKEELEGINADQNYGEEDGLSHSKRIEKSERKTDFKQASSRRSDADSMQYTSAEKIKGKWYQSSSASKEVKETKCSVLGWRDPNYRYKRNYSMKPTLGNTSWKPSSEEERLDKYNRRYTNLEKFRGNGDITDNLKLGAWSLIVATDIIQDNGKTESQNVWNSIDKICFENKDIFIKPPTAFKWKDFNARLIHCFTSDHTDKDTVYKAAVLIRRNLPLFSFVIYYSHFSSGNRKLIFMNLAEDEFYECNTTNNTTNNIFKLVPVKCLPK